MQGVGGRLFEERGEGNPDGSYWIGALFEGSSERGTAR